VWGRRWSEERREESGGGGDFFEEERSLEERGRESAGLQSGSGTDLKSYTDVLYAEKNNPITR
jgi:hypothetical protein